MEAKDSRQICLLKILREEYETVLLFVLSFFVDTRILIHNDCTKVPRVEL